MSTNHCTAHSGPTVLKPAGDKVCYINVLPLKMLRIWNPIAFVVTHNKCAAILGSFSAETLFSLKQVESLAAEILIILLLVSGQLCQLKTVLKLVSACCEHGQNNASVTDRIIQAERSLSRIWIKATFSCGTYVNKRNLDTLKITYWKYGSTCEWGGCWAACLWNDLGPVCRLESTDTPQGGGMLFL